MSEIDLSTLISTYEKFQQYKLQMKEANKRYRLTEKGKEKSKNDQQKWLASKKDDDAYRLSSNEKQRERYRKRVNARKNAISTNSSDLGERSIVIDNQSVSISTNCHNLNQLNK